MLDPAGRPEQLTVRFGLGLAALSAALAARPALAVDVTFTGSGAVDYRAFFGPPQTGPVLPSSIGIDSTTLEVASKVVIDVTPHVSVSVKLCFGCHGIELDQGFGEFHVNDYLNARVGRFNVPVGEFNVRHDPANYTTPSKPLPYAMGDMLYYRANQFNLGVVPTPYSDNGLELFGSLWIGHRLMVDYSFYAVKGFRGSNDLDFVGSRSYLDNNHTPAVGTRWVATLGPVSIGASAGGGFYDANDSLRYLFYGAEAYARLGPVVFRGELIYRLTDFNPSVPGYRFVAVEPYFLKLGYYGQLDWNVTDWLTVIYRADGLHRMGMPLPGSEVDQVFSGIFRNTGAVAVRFNGNLMLKAGYEYWYFLNTAYGNEHVMRVGLVYNY